MTALTTTCVIAGGGPAGVMLGYLLARAGVAVTVLEKHADFFRDFRGDTIHPSTLQLMHELGVLDAFLERPHQTMLSVGGVFGGKLYQIADFAHLPTACKYVAFMPQWDFLNFLAQQGKRFPGFDLSMNTDATDLIEENDRIVGVRATGPDGPFEILADLTVGADGRHSTVRDRAGFVPVDIGAPIDVLWLRVTRRADDPHNALGTIDRGRLLVTLNRGEYWQCAYIIPKDSFETLRARGLPAFRADLAAIAPFLRDRVDEIADWDQVKLLTVAVNRLSRWYKPGLLCIGDAAHAMSPVGGVGINLAVQDAVAAANILAAPLRDKRVRIADLAALQRRRELPVRVTQAMQVLIQNRVMRPVLGGGDRRARAPWLLHLFNWLPPLRRVPGRLIGMGFRPEHIRTPAV